VEEAEIAELDRYDMQSAYMLQRKRKRRTVYLNVRQMEGGGADEGKGGSREDHDNEQLPQPRFVVRAL
jgi:hypothetical protein